MHGLAGRTRLALDRRLSMSNLLERLARLHGASPAMRLRHPIMPSLFPGSEISFLEARCLTDLAAEALIRALDLRKGERVMVLTPDAGEALLLTAALVKAGGISVTLPGLPEEGELDLMLRGGGIKKALVGGGFFRIPREARLDPLRERKGFRIMAVEGQGAVPGETSLEEACTGSSGFFIPYTLKPSSVVAISPLRGKDGKIFLVMATSRALLHPARLLSWLLPVHPGERCLFLASPDGPSRLAAAVLALCAGLCLEFSPEAGTVGSSQGKVAGVPRVVIADPTRMPDLSGYKRVNPLPPGARIWISLGELEGTTPSAPGPPGVGGISRNESPLLLEFISMNETAPLALFRFSWLGGRFGLRTPFLPVPPHRVRLESGSSGHGRRVEAIKGPAVTPGWWNDLEASLRAWEGGWFRPGAVLPPMSLPAREA
ncbi:MAG: hypothetical protein ACUVRX_10900 [Actinomycetota bacterium]